LKSIEPSLTDRLPWRLVLGVIVVHLTMNRFSP
jgi:hypothetical protein